MKTASAILVAAWCLTATAALAQPVETELAGVTAELVELRQSGGVLRLAVRFANAETKTANFNAYEVSRIVLVDAKSKKKHLPIKDANGHWVAGPIGDDIDGGRIVLKIPARQATVVWAYFEPVPAGTVMNVEVPHVFPFDNVPVTDGPGKVFASGTATTTPGGGLATIVSAKRADQVLNVRLRLTAERGERVELLDSYLRFKHVFLFDPVAKRKYPLVKDSEGDFQGQPLQVKGDGGSFVFDWRKTTLVSLTFQAPPDTVQRADLLLPQFLPFEGLTIEGLGGAAAGGIADGRQDARARRGAERAEGRGDRDGDQDRSRGRRALRLRQGRDQETGGADAAEPGDGAQGQSRREGRHRRTHRWQGRRRLQPDACPKQRAASVKQWLVANAQVDGASIVDARLGQDEAGGATTRSPTARTIPRAARRIGASRSSCARVHECWLWRNESSI